MSTRIEQFCTEGQLSPEYYRNIRLMTILSKLVMALVLIITVMIVSFGMSLFA
jgi:hypothetical protein